MNWSGIIADGGCQMGNLGNVNISGIGYKDIFM